MSGETEQNVSGWTTDTLRDLLLRLVESNDLRYQQRFDAQEQALQAALTAAEKAVNAALLSAQQAVNKAEVAAEKRFEAVNEFRGQLADQARTLAPREYVEGQLDAIDKRLIEAGVARQVSLDEARSFASALLPREVFEAAFASSTADRALLRDRIGALEGEVKASRRASAAYATAVGFVFTVVVIVLQVISQ